MIKAPARPPRLDARRTVYFALCLSLSPAWAGGIAQSAETASFSPPSDAEQTRLLDAMREYAQKYVSNLPNFICVQVTRQFEAGRKPNRWHKGDSLTSKLVFNHGREERALQLVNDKQVTPGMRRWRTPLTTEGEFGILLGTVFGSMSNTSFVWSRWEVVGETRLAVFDYSVDVAHSTLKLSLSDLAHAIVPYHGTVYADPVTGAIWRISSGTADIPREVKTRSISTIIDYKEVVIGGIAYLLPAKASILLVTDDNHVRNEIEFTGYRKFEADSIITYASDETGGNAQAANSAAPHN
ncbi:MAG: hypothetical protein WB992_14695 [Bryobacteraceae bacterium]